MKSCTIHPRASDTSRVLTEARTVLSRAESAIRAINADIERDGETRRDYGSRTPVEYHYEADPDAAHIVRALSAVTESLENWRKCYSDCEGRA